MTINFKYFLFLTQISDHYPIVITIDCVKFNLDGSGGAAGAACPLPPAAAAGGP